MINKKDNQMFNDEKNLEDFLEIALFLKSAFNKVSKEGNQKINYHKYEQELLHYIKPYFIDTPLDVENSVIRKYLKNNISNYIERMLKEKNKIYFLTYHDKVEDFIKDCKQDISIWQKEQSCLIEKNKLNIVVENGTKAKVKKANKI